MKSDQPSPATAEGLFTQVRPSHFPTGDGLAQPWKDMDVSRPGLGRQTMLVTLGKRCDFASGGGLKGPQE